MRNSKRFIILLLINVSLCLVACKKNDVEISKNNVEITQSDKEIEMTEKSIELETEIAIDTETTSENDESYNEEITWDESENTSLDDNYDTWIKATDSNYYYTEKKLDFKTTDPYDTSETHDMYVVFDWTEVNGYPMEAYVHKVNNNDSESTHSILYYKDGNESYGNHMVFHVVDASVNDEYSLYVRTYDSLGNCSVSCYEKSTYMWLYYNIDENGEPARSFDIE